MSEVNGGKREYPKEIYRDGRIARPSAKAAAAMLTGKTVATKAQLQKLSELDAEFRATVAKSDQVSTAAAGEAFVTQAAKFKAAFVDGEMPAEFAMQSRTALHDKFRAGRAVIAEKLQALTDEAKPIVRAVLQQTTEALADVMAKLEETERAEATQNDVPYVPSEKWRAAAALVIGLGSRIPKSGYRAPSAMLAGIVQL
ncbi:MAG TPA: hypothetical protein VN673_03395 [Clostridia bacterium]|nr:hypothetical protein [Clostridia bacterium]